MPRTPASFSPGFLSPLLLPSSSGLLHTLYIQVRAIVKRLFYKSFRRGRRDTALSPAQVPRHLSTGCFREPVLCVRSAPRRYRTDNEHRFTRFPVAFHRDIGNLLIEPDETARILPGSSSARRRTRGPIRDATTRLHERFGENWKMKRLREWRNYRLTGIARTKRKDVEKKTWTRMPRRRKIPGEERGGEEIPVCPTTSSPVGRGQR